MRDRSWLPRLAPLVVLTTGALLPCRALAQQPPAAASQTRAAPAQSPAALSSAPGAPPVAAVPASSAARPEKRTTVAFSFGFGGGWGGVLGSERGAARDSVILTYSDGTTYSTRFGIMSLPLSVSVQRRVHPRLRVGLTGDWRWDLETYDGNPDKAYQSFSGTSLFASRNSFVVGPTYTVARTETTDWDLGLEVGGFYGRFSPLAAPREALATSGGEVISVPSVSLYGAAMRASFFLWWTEQRGGAWSMGCGLYYDLWWTRASRATYAEGRTSWLDQGLVFALAVRAGW